MSKQLQKRIDLESLPKAEARVEIAKDVVAALKTKKLRAKPGTYFRGIRNKRDTSNPSFVDSFATMKTCHVCALGALFAAKVGRLPNTKVSTFNADSTFFPASVHSTLLRDYFSQEQLHAVEDAFEGWGSDMRFTENYPDHEDRMVAIMQNIIRNKGTFEVTAP